MTQCVVTIEGSYYLKVAFTHFSKWRLWSYVDHDSHTQIWCAIFATTQTKFTISPVAVVESNECIIHDQSAGLAGVGAKGLDQWKKGRRLLQRQCMVLNHPLDDLQRCHLGGLISTISQQSSSMLRSISYDKQYLTQSPWCLEINTSTVSWICRCCHVN